VSSPVVAAVARLVVPVALVVAAGLLVKGYTAAGDGFTAGAVVAIALGLQLVAGEPREVVAQPLIRFSGQLAGAGLAIALLVAFAPLLFGDPPLSHVPAPDAEVVKVGSLELTSAFAFDVGVFLLVVGAVAGILGALQRDTEAQEHA
jgi:multicomponent Na+:H+ antiporter subunit B